MLFTGDLPALMGPLIVGIDGPVLQPEEVDILSHPSVGGVILFSRNMETLNGLRQLVRSIKQIKQPGLWVCVDQEGGRVQRFVRDFTILPPLRDYGDLYDRDPIKACREVRQHGLLMGEELRRVGVDFSFAPVLDIDNGHSDVIRSRGFHQHPWAIIDLMMAHIAGQRAANMPAVVKHFPGHGSVVADTHTTVVEDDRVFSEIYHQDLQPFAWAVETGVMGVMLSHVLYPALDNQPAGFSPFWVKTILRDMLGFRGYVFSDDLGMAGIGVQSQVDAMRQALSIGVDGILHCNDRSAIISALEALEKGICIYDS